MHLYWRRKTQSKNAITIGGVGQFAQLRKNTRAEEMNGSAKSQYEQLIAAKGCIEACAGRDGCVYMRGDATPTFTKTVPNLFSNKRHVLFVDEAFFVIVDEIKLSEPEKINHRLHALWPFEIGKNSADMKGEGASLRVLFATDVDITQTDVFDAVDPSEIKASPRSTIFARPRVRPRASTRLYRSFIPMRRARKSPLRSPARR